VIPQRIKMTGLLSYRSEQEVAFDGASLWMLAGANGSGKSSIFDGVTYALFGCHRGGTQNAGELINKESPGLTVEFDFRLDGELYRIKRTLKRNPRGSAATTQQVFHTRSGGTWEPVPDTSKKVDFDRWISEKIGLTYETFTSSVLLLQGKAEKLLDAKPAGRAEVLGRVVGLDRYEKLYEKANRRKLDLKSLHDALEHQVEGVPEVKDEDYAGAVLKVEQCEDNRREAQQTIDRLVALEARAHRWTDTKSRLDAARLRLKSAEALLGEAVAIEKAHARLQELWDVLPAVNTVVTMRAKSQESQRKTDLLLRQKTDAQDRRERSSHALDQARSKRASLQKTLAEDEKKHGEVNLRLRELQGLLEKVRLVEQQDATLRQLEADLARLPANPEQEARDAQAEADRLTELNRVLPILERFQTERHELAEALRSAEAARAEQARVQEEGEKAKAELARLAPEVEAARKGRGDADQAVAVAKSQAESARAALDEFIRLAGAANCTACGQPLTPEHFADEKAKRERESAAAASRHRDALDARQKAHGQEKELTEREAALKKLLEELRIQYKEHAAHAKQYTADVKRLTDALALKYAEMPEPYRGRIATTTADDWTRTHYPERDELVALRREVGGLDAARRRLRETTDTLAKYNDLRARADNTRQTLHSLRTSLPGGDADALKREQLDRSATEKTLVEQIRAAKQLIEQLDREIDTLGQESHTAVQVLTDLAGKLQTEEVTRKHCAESIAAAMTAIPASWQEKVESAGLAEYAAWKSEEETLAADGIEVRFRELEQARGGLNTLRQEIAGLEAEAGSFKPEEQLEPETVRQMAAEARRAFDVRDEELQAARRELTALDHRREQRAKLSEQQKETDRQFNRYKILSELLGRDRLQRHLVRRAERQIVDYANAVLDRLSGGQLYLKLVAGDDGGAADKALDLECSNRVTGGTGINVAFLSGSQKFRVAVSLALAIGQYASRQHKPIESVIIDEGFGCLDRQGRQVMIQELQNLRGHLRCILLVSHQEEFADAFPDGYRFELKDGATQVTRFQR
jgi:DNA repair exonuclease SbcCD ATPase subunit